MFYCFLFFPGKFWVYESGNMFSGYNLTSLSKTDFLHCLFAMDIFQSTRSKFWIDNSFPLASSPHVHEYQKQYIHHVPAVSSSLNLQIPTSLKPSADLLIFTSFLAVSSPSQASLHDDNPTIRYSTFPKLCCL